MAKDIYTENTVTKTDKPWLFKPGQSGNPAGKPKGTRHKATQAALVLLEGETEALTRKAVELALEGDTTALKMCLDRIASMCKGWEDFLSDKGINPETLEKACMPSHPILRIIKNMGYVSPDDELAAEHKQLWETCLRQLSGR